jgi:type II secretory pathway predicted ATPase ExeA
VDGTTAVAFLVSSALSFDGILEYALAEFGIPTPGASRAQRLLAFQSFLIERSRAGQSVLLILDEAHRLTRTTLEHIRQLSNLETPTRVRPQILLVGQPELEAKLALPALRQLRQHITLRAAIPPLSARDVHRYVRRRLQIAGARDLDLFTRRAVARIAAYAGGIPRVINTVCEHCLLIGYADQRRDLDVDVVKRAVRYLDGRADTRTARFRTARHPWLPSRRFAWAALTPMLLGLMALPVLRRDTFDSLSHALAPLVIALVQSARGLLGP